jgi:hypothetical protein
MPPPAKPRPENDALEGQVDDGSLPATPSAQEQGLDFQDFMPAEILHNYYNQRAENQLRFKGRPIASGMRVLVLEAIQDRGFDGTGTYLDIKGSGWIGRPDGVVRIYMAAKEFDKLQSETYVYRSMDRRRYRPDEVAIDAILIGLNEYGSLTLRSGTIVPWSQALLAPQAPARQISANRLPQDGQLVRVRGIFLPTDSDSQSHVARLYSDDGVRVLAYATAETWKVLRSHSVDHPGLLGARRLALTGTLDREFHDRVVAAECKRSPREVFFVVRDAKFDGWE